jgi:RNA polymerase sigma-70 factor (ECF subfamily)
VSFSDPDLIARVVLHDDRNAFGELVRRHQSSVRSLLRRLTCGDLALADDLAQETFIRAYKGLKGFKGGAKLSTWLYRIAYNVFCADKGRRREAPMDEAEANAKAEAQTAERRASAPTAVLRVDLDRAMSLLSPVERAVIALAFAMDATHEEVAAILDCPLGTVKTHILRSRKKLQHQLREWSRPELAHAR